MDNLENPSPLAPEGADMPANGGNSKIRKVKIHSAVIFLVLLVAAAAIFYYVKVWNKKGPEQRPGAKLSQPVYVPTVANTQEMFRQRSKLDFPRITGEKTAAISDLPQDIKGVLGQNAGKAIANKLVFENGKTGFDIIYPTASSLQDAYTQLLMATKDWQVLYSARAKLAAMHQAKKGSYQLQANLISVNDSKTQVEIQILIQ